MAPMQGPSAVLVLMPSGETALAMEDYIDASFGCHGYGKSHTGMIITSYGCTVMCMSSKQKIVTRDSTEAELVALSDKIMSVLQCQDFLRAQGMECAVCAKGISRQHLHHHTGD